MGEVKDEVKKLLHSKENLNLMKKGRATLHEDFNVPNNINNLKPVWP